jgi:hypothetical protein
MKTLTTLVSTLALALPFAAHAEVPNACEIVKIEDINSIASGKVEKTQQLKSGNPSECNFIDSHRAAILTLSIREVQYAAENELQQERENLEKIYRGKVKWLTGMVGDDGFWMPVNKQLMFRKGKKLISVKFSRPQNQNEVDSSQVARLVDAKLPPK